MSEGLTLSLQLRDSIDADIAARTQALQARLAPLGTGRANVVAAVARAAPPATGSPLVMLAHGWGRRWPLPAGPTLRKAQRSCAVHSWVSTKC